MITIIALLSLIFTAFVNADGDLPSFRYLAGLGPYITRDSMGVSPHTPQGCEVDQVIMIARHGERYPEAFEYKNMLNTLEKVQNSGELSGPLEFLNNYTMFMNENDCELETSTGMYNGHYGIELFGQQLREKYKHLVPPSPSSKLNIFSAGQERVYDSANHFTQGFFGTNWTNQANVISLPEHGDESVDTLTPANFCVDKYNNLTGDYTDQAVEFREKNFPSIIKRLQEYTKAELNTSDVYNLINFCSYELNAQGDSEFCRAFSEDELKSYTYFQSVNMYYGYGGGQTGGSIASGSVYTNATKEILKQGPEKMGPLYFNFAHDTDIIAALAALNLFVPEKGVPYDKRDSGNEFEISQITPQEAHFILERITCGGKSFVRLSLNDAYIPLPGCQSGPGRSCPLERYEDHVEQYYQSYEEKCGITPGHSKFVKFFWENNNKDFGQ